MNAYEAKLEARRERLEARATKLRIESSNLYGRASSMASIIPFGQPILVGHHSEGKDRRYRGRIDSTFRKAFALSDKAAEVAGRAASVGTGGISSDDEDAVAKLREKLVKLEKTQESMKSTNKLVKKNDRAGLAKLGFSEDEIHGLFKPDFAGRIGFASFEITNNGANIRRIKERIEQLEALATKPVMETLEGTLPDGNGWTITEDAEDNRIVVRFDEKPSKETLLKLKRNGFKWSPTRGAHVRMRGGYALFYAKDAVGADVPSEDVTSEDAASNV
jgi:hypothetical protein